MTGFFFGKVSLRVKFFENFLFRGEVGVLGAKADCYFIPRSAPSPWEEVHKRSSHETSPQRSEGEPPWKRGQEGSRSQQLKVDHWQTRSEINRPGSYTEKQSKSASTLWTLLEERRSNTTELPNRDKAVLARCDPRPFELNGSQG